MTSPDHEDDPRETPQEDAELTARHGLPANLPAAILALSPASKLRLAADLIDQARTMTTREGAMTSLAIARSLTSHVAAELAAVEVADQVLGRRGA